jgi:phenylalanyl-tRNA synthetase alpha subunit
MQHPARRLRDAWAWASMLACQESEKRVLLARLHATCMAARLFRPLVWANMEGHL